MSRKNKHPIDPRPQTPAGFIEFFEGEFQRRLDRVRIIGMDEPSWDRCAAWLLWKAEHHDRED